MKKSTDETINEIHEMQRKNSGLVKKWGEALFFTKFLVSFLFSAEVIFAGAYAVYKGLHMSYDLARINLVVAGVSAALMGVGLMWSAVMKLRG